MSISFQELMQIALCESAGRGAVQVTYPEWCPGADPVSAWHVSFPSLRIKGQGADFQSGAPCVAWRAQREPLVQQRLFK